MGNEASSNAVHEHDPGDHAASSRHVTDNVSPSEATTPSNPISAVSSKPVTTSSRFSSLFRSQIAGSTSSKSTQHQTSTSGQGDLVGVCSTSNKDKIHDNKPTPLQQRLPLVDGFHGPQHIPQGQADHAKGNIYSSNSHLKQNSQLTVDEDPVTQNMMNMSMKPPEEHHQHNSGMGLSAHSGSSTKHHQNSSARSLGKDLDAWENAWEEDDESSEGDDVLDEHDTLVQYPPKGLQLHQDINATIPHHIPPPGATSSVASTHISEKAAKVSILPSEDEVKTLGPEAHRELSEAMNGITWDTYSAGYSITGIYEKPNIQMFLPLLRVLGKGSFGKVVLVQKNKGQEKGGLYAMKILKKSHLIKKRQIERTKTERKVLSVVDHPFIMKLHYAFQSEDKLYLVLDYCAGGELFFHLSRLRRFPERVAKFYTAELLLALGYLHNKGIIYRDLKPENVLLDADGHVKLGDFGLAKDRISHPYKGAASVCGTPEYMAPEILQQWGHGFCVDYWGLGMLTYEMMTGLPPWYTTDREKLFRRLKSAPLDIPPFFLPQAVSFVSGLLERDPRRRLGVKGVKTVIAHDFFRGLDFRDLHERKIDAPIRPCEGWKLPDPDRNFKENYSLQSSQPPSSDATSNNNDPQLPSKELDAATQNFDQSFTRMPVDSVAGQDDGNSGGDFTDNNDILNSFLGFTFDERKKSEDQDDDAPRLD